MTSKNHHFFFLSPNPLPIVMTFGSFNLLFSILMFFKFSEFTCLILNLILTLYFSLFWWILYSDEMNFSGNNSLSLEGGVKFGMILFISSEIFFFFSFFWSYFHYFLSPTLEVGFSWPPFNVVSFDFLNVPLINTLILLTSGVTVTCSHFYLMSNKKTYSSILLSLTVILGVLFSTLQWMEYKTSFFCVSDSNFGTSFFVLTGFHGMHVIIGSLYLLITLYRSNLMIGTKLNFLSFELSSWYWHFVDVVWIFLYFFLYYMTN